METIERSVVRVALDVLSFDAPKDVIRKQLVQFWRCNDLEFQIGIFRNEMPVDVRDWDAIYLSIRELDQGNPPSGGSPTLMLGSTQYLDSTVTLETWQSGAQQHAVITFSSEGNALEAGEYWLSLWAVTTAQRTVTLGSGVCKILENGGVSTTPPEPKDVYYTAEVCDQRFAFKGEGGEGGTTVVSGLQQKDLDRALKDYYTATVCDQRFSRKSEVGPSSGLQQSDLDTALRNYYLKTEIDTQLSSYAKHSALDNYYTVAACDAKFQNYYSKSEITTQFVPYAKTSDIAKQLNLYATQDQLTTQLQNYYTSTECEERFELKGEGGGGGEISPKEKGSLLLGDGEQAVILPAGTVQQVLVADPTKTLGAAWTDYPWHRISEYQITDAVPNLVFENNFDFGRWWHYRLDFDFLETSIVGTQVRMQYGYDQNGSTIWENNINEYCFSTADFAGSAGRYAAYTFLYGYFGFGNEEKFYRNDGGYIHGSVDFWNDGNAAHRVYAQARTNSFRIANDTPVATGGIYNFVYYNVGAHVISAFKLMPAEGTFKMGRFALYGIR
ncbi:MAG: hypothetical protein LW808_003220 [Verrucomicrobiota bacterium]|nr:MAG: hypothetical protein LW808_003220 [Verrucomicrobiota bacterium]